MEGLSLAALRQGYHLPINVKLGDLLTILRNKFGLSGRYVHLTNYAIAEKKPIDSCHFPNQKTILIYGPCDYNQSNSISICDLFTCPGVEYIILVGVKVIYDD